MGNGSLAGGKGQYEESMSTSFWAVFNPSIDIDLLLLSVDGRNEARVFAACQGALAHNAYTGLPLGYRRLREKVF